MEELISKCKKAKHIMFITGAGVSAASGLPTYRGVGGLYAGKSLLPPEIAMSKYAWKLMPSLIWKHLHKGYGASSNVVPSIAHDSISLIEALVDKVTVVTQNVDGLHRKAGSSDVIELHGSADYLICEKCDYQESPDFTSLPKLPKCPKCKYVLRPPVVLFGENLPENSIDRLERALESKPDVVIAVGTSGNFSYVVEPLRYIREIGGFTAVIDPILSPNLAAFTDLWIKNKAEVILPKLAGALPAC